MVSARELPQALLIVSHQLLEQLLDGRHQLVEELDAGAPGQDHPEAGRATGQVVQRGKAGTPLGVIEELGDASLVYVKVDVDYSTTPAYVPAARRPRARMPGRKK